MNVLALDILDATIIVLLSTIIVLLSIIAGLVLIWVGDWLIETFCPEDPCDLYKQPGEGVDIDAIHHKRGLYQPQPRPPAAPASKEGLPALAKIEADAKKAAPMPAEVRELASRLKTKPLTADTARAF